MFPIELYKVGNSKSAIKESEPHCTKNEVFH